MAGLGQGKSVEITERISSGAKQPADEKTRLRDNFYKMAGSRPGLYALIDYVNFKGEGVKEEEKYKGQGWGLRNVLLEMGPSAGGQASANEFSEAAKRVLQRRL